MNSVYIDLAIEEIQHTIERYEKCVESNMQKTKKYKAENNKPMEFFVDGRATIYKTALDDLKHILGIIKKAYGVDVDD